MEAHSHVCFAVEYWEIIYHQSEFGIREKKILFFVRSINKILAKCSVGSNGKLVETRNFTIYPFKAVGACTARNSVRKENKNCCRTTILSSYSCCFCVEIYIENVWISFGLALRFVEIRVGFEVDWLTWPKNLKYFSKLPHWVSTHLWLRSQKKN